MTVFSTDKPRFTDIFVERPIIAVVISLIFILLGLRAMGIMPVLQFPKIESTSLSIRTAYVGASAEVVQGFITDPVERAASTIPGVDYMDSRTSAGFSEVTVHLKMNEDSTKALAELSSRLDQIRYELPQGAQDPSIQISRADRPYAAFYLSVPIHEHTTRAKVSDYLRRYVNPSIASIPGVQRVTIEGGRLPAMRIWLDPQRMAMFNISAQDVEAALTRNNVIATIGRSENYQQRMDLMVNTSMASVDDFERMVIVESEDALIRVADIARVEMGEEEGTVTTGYGPGASVFLAIWPLPGANEIAIADVMYDVLDEIAPTLPDGIEITIAYDATENMRASLREIFITLIETILLVGIVVVLFMGSFRTAIVPLITIPISILGAIFVMSLMGFTMNLLTVLAVVLCVGLVVDDAIVVVENVARFMREGMSRKQAALASSRQLLSPIIGMTLTLAAVYTPIGFLSGLTGVLFKEFAFTLAVAVLISGVVALTLSPIMSAYVCAENGREGRFTDYVNHIFDVIKSRYGKLLDVSLRYTPQVLCFAVFIALLMVPFYFYSKQELAPLEDEGQIIVIVNSPPEAAPDYTNAYMQQVVDAMGALPNTEDMWRVMFPAYGFGGQHFVPFEDRDFATADLMPEVYGKLSQITGVQALPILPPSLPTSGNFDVEMMIQSSEPLEKMLPYAGKLVDAAFASGKFMFADSDLRIDLPQGQLSLDRERVADLGMTLSDVSQQISFLMSGNFVNRFNHNGKSAQVIPMIEKGGRSDADALLDIQIRTPSDDLVPLSALVTLEKRPSPRFLGKFQQKNSFKIFGGAAPGVTKEEALASIEAAAIDILPADYTVDYVGESRQLRNEGTTLMAVLAIALVFVFFVLAIQFNSFRDPLVILLGSVPLALSGAMLFTFLGLTTINIFSQVGFITLVGLVAKNAILIVEFAKQLQENGASKFDAIHRAAMVRLRPVLMTTGATVLGHFPLVLVVGAGAESRNSIGIVLVAGMLVGTLFTLFILPSVYLLLGVEKKHTPALPLEQAEKKENIGITAT